MSLSARVTISHELELAVERLLSEARNARAAVAVLDGSSDEDAARFADSVATTLASMELDLRIARAALTARRSEQADDLGQSIREVVDAAHTWYDDAAVQAALARMELRDQSQGLALRLERATAAAKEISDDLAAKFGNDLDTMRRTASDAIRSIRGVLGDVVAGIADSGI